MQSSPCGLLKSFDCTIRSARRCFCVLSNILCKFVGRQQICTVHSMLLCSPSDYCRICIAKVHLRCSVPYSIDFFNDACLYMSFSEGVTEGENFTCLKAEDVEHKIEVHSPRFLNWIQLIFSVNQILFILFSQ